MKSERGFTLIELLVVIAIIGILSSVVLASLNSAREKGKNAKIKEQLANARSAASVFYDENGNTYNGTAGDISGSCTTANSMFTDVNSKMAEFSNVVNYPLGIVLTCYSVQNDYAISASLATPDSGLPEWCVDSTGASKPIAGPITTTAC